MYHALFENLMMFYINFVAANWRSKNNGQSIRQRNTQGPRHGNK